MALEPKRSAAAANAACDAMTALMNSGILRIYSGTKPASVSAAITGTLLAELTLNSTAFGAAASGVATANAITGDTSANATGTATHFRIFASNGTTAIMDGTVGTSASDLVVNTTSFVSGAAVDITSLTVTESLG